METRSWYKRLVLSVGLYLSLWASAEAVLTINIREHEEDVVVSFAGSLDLTGLDFRRSIEIDSEMAPHAGFLLSSPDGELADEYRATTPVNLPFFGEGASGDQEVFLKGDDAAGSVFGVGAKQVFLPKGYRSQEHLAGKTTYSDSSFSSLKLERGVYTTTVPNDVIVMVVGSGLTSQTPAPDPEPDPDPDAGSDPEPDPEPEPDPDTGPVAGGSNILVNGEFDSSISPWRFYTNGKGSASIDSPGYGGSSGAVFVDVITKASNIQLFQNELVLEPDTEYELSFWAFSNSGRDLRVSLGQHSSPYTNYGLNRAIVDLGNGWEFHRLTFTTTGFSTTVSNGRLFFWFARDARAGDRYYIDEAKLAIKGQ